MKKPEELLLLTGKTQTANTEIRKYGNTEIRKYGNTFNIKLPDECVKIIKMEKPSATSDRIFPYNSGSMSTKFSRMTNSMKMSDVTLHSLRHDGISRYFEQGWNIPQVTHLSGHSNWNNLRRYTHLHLTEVPDLFTACMKLEKEYKEKKLRS